MRSTISSWIFLKALNASANWPLRFRVGRSSIEPFAAELSDPVRSVARAVLNFLAILNLPTKTVFERPRPFPSTLSFSFLDGGVEIDFVTDGSTRRYLMVRVSGFAAFRWLMYILRLTQPQRFRDECRIQTHCELRSDFIEGKRTSLF
jgi:hypothetical protein